MCYLKILTILVWFVVINNAQKFAIVTIKNESCEKLYVSEFRRSDDLKDFSDPFFYYILLPSHYLTVTGFAYNKEQMFGGIDFREFNGFCNNDRRAYFQVLFMSGNRYVGLKYVSLLGRRNPYIAYVTWVENNFAEIPLAYGNATIHYKPKQMEYIGMLWHLPEFFCAQLFLQFSSLFITFNTLWRNLFLMSFMLQKAFCSQKAKENYSREFEPYLKQKLLYFINVNIVNLKLFQYYKCFWVRIKNNWTNLKHFATFYYVFCIIFSIIRH